MKTLHLSVKRQRWYARVTDERFWPKVDKRGPDECWPWLGTCGLEGRGRFYLQGRMMTAPRAALILSGTDVPNGLLACHKCDNKLCVNPAHLYVGTHSDNLRDAYERGQNPRYKRTRGSRHGMAKLTEGDVLEIRALYGTGAWTLERLGRRYGVCMTAIAKAVNRKTWSHI